MKIVKKKKTYYTSMLWIAGEFIDLPEPIDNAMLPLTSRYKIGFQCFNNCPTYLHASRLNAYLFPGTEG